MAEDLRRIGGGLLGGIGSAIGNAGTILSFSKYFPDVLAAIKILGQFGDIEEPIGTAAGLKARLLLACDLGDLVAKNTVTTADDELIKSARKLTDNEPLLGFAAALLARFFTEVPTATPAAFQAFVERPDVAESIREAVTENQFDLASLMKAFDLIMQLIQIIRSFSGSNGAASPTAPETKPGGVFGF